MNRKKWVFFSSLSVPVVIAAIIFYNPRSKDPEQDILLSKVIQRSFDIQVSTIGVLDAARSHMLSSEIRSDEAKILYIIDDGSHVKKGDLLVKIDSTPFEERVEKLKSELSAIQSSVVAKEQMLEWEKNQVEKNINSSEFNLKVARLDLKRLINGEGPLQLSQYSTEANKARQECEKFIIYRDDLKKLEEKGFSNLSEISEAEKKIEELKEKYTAAEKKLSSYRDHVFPLLKKTAQAKVEKAEMDILQTKNGGVFKIAKAIADLEETKGRLTNKRTQLNQAQKELTLTKLKAPFDGIAILYETYRDGERRKPRVGDRVLRNQPILYLPDISTMIVKTNIREVDLNKISLQQDAAVKVDAYPDINLAGKVGFIGALASEVTNSGAGGKFFQLTITITTRENRLRPGMTARVMILSSQVRDKLSVPVSAVFQSDNQFFCYKYSDDRFFRTLISRGKQNTDYVEIRSGLDKGDLVSLVKPDDEMIVTNRSER